MSNPWTREQDAQLIAMRKAGATFTAISGELGRGTQTCINHHALLLAREAAAHGTAAVKRRSSPERPAKPQLAKRRCLNTDCRKWFVPEHKGQYFHDRCRKRDESGLNDAVVRNPSRAGF